MTAVDVGFRLSLLRSLVGGPRLADALRRSMAEEHARKQCAEADDREDWDDDEDWEWEPADEDEYKRALSDGHEWFTRALKEAVYLGQVEASGGVGGKTLTLTLAGAAAINVVAQLPQKAASRTGE